MVSVGLGRASRGLTANVFTRRRVGTAAQSAAAQRSAGRQKEGFLTREERRRSRRGEET